MRKLLIAAFAVLALGAFTVAPTFADNPAGNPDAAEDNPSEHVGNDNAHGGNDNANGGNKGGNDNRTKGQGKANNPNSTN